MTLFRVKDHDGLYKDSSTGAIIKVPLFISEGEIVTIDTRNGEYQGRA